MKKMMAVVLALMIAAMGSALADTASVPVTTAEGCLLIRIEKEGKESLVLLGSGSGADVFEAFASAADDYAGRFEALWSMLSLMEPSLTLNGSAANLCFESGASENATVVTLNGVVVAQLKGLDAFAILSGEDHPAVRGECDVRIWTAQSAGITGEICVNCGEADDGSSRHAVEISQFCIENHTECMGDPIHHCDACGRDYLCSSSGSHTPCAVCGKAWCDKSEGDHTTLECGHRGCQVFGSEEDHLLCTDCGGYVCDGSDHSHADELPEGDVIVIGDAASHDS